MTNKVIAYCHKTMLIKAKIQSAINFPDKKRTKGLSKDVFKSNGIFYTTGYKILKSSNPCILKKNLNRKKTKERKKVIIANQIRKMEKIVQNKGLKDCALMETAENGGKNRGFRLNN